ncbi:MAG: BACON domain-containing protein [Prevotellaceae bacterium]|jgi:hypothetical protein|nr:BACON domain-containing protein [Prevotellaceae bacterium]
MKTTNFWLFIATALMVSATLTGCGKDDDGGDPGNGNGNGTSSTVTLPIGPGSVTFAIQTSEPWSQNVTGNPSWVSVTPKSGDGSATLTVTVKDFHIDNINTRTATVVINDKNVTLAQPPFITNFPDLTHPNPEGGSDYGYSLLLSGTNLVTGTSTYRVADSPDDPGDYFRFGDSRGYTADEDFVGAAVDSTKWDWFLDYNMSGFRDLSNTDLAGMVRLVSGEELGRLWGSDNNLEGTSGYPSDFEAVPYQWREADSEAGNRIAGMFIGYNAEDATIADLKGTVFFPAAGYKDADTGDLEDYGEKGYYISWAWTQDSNNSDWIFVVSEDGLELWGNGDDNYKANWKQGNAGSIRFAGLKLYLGL